ncbi:MAG TPA: DUF3788 family protein [Planctomycetota bacterium]
MGALLDEAARPTDRSLAGVLGRSHAAWTRLRTALQAAHGPMVEQWHFAGKAFGWSFRLRQGKRVLVYLLPCRSSFLASFALGEKACLAARTSGIPAPVLALIEAAPRYAEGRGVRIPVRTQKDVDAVLRIAALEAAGRSGGAQSARR